jgi:hypothetical protein
MTVLPAPSFDEERTMKRKPMLTLWTAVLLFGLGPGRSTPVLAGPQEPTRPVTTSLWVPFEFDTGQGVFFAGSLHLLVQAIPQEPIIPGNPVRPLRVLVNGLVFGTGGTQALFAFDTRGPFPGTGEFSEILVPFRVQIPGNPVMPLLSVKLFLILNPDGTVDGGTEFGND